MCVVDGCQRTDIHGHGMCHLHYQRWRNAVPLHKPTPQQTYTDLLDLIRVGETPPVALARVGVSTAAAAQWMRRHGHLDLARLYGRAAKTERNRR